MATKTDIITGVKVKNDAQEYVNVRDIWYKDGTVWKQVQKAGLETTLLSPNSGVLSEFLSQPI